MTHWQLGERFLSFGLINLQPILCPAPRILRGGKPSACFRYVLFAGRMADLRCGNLW